MSMRLSPLVCALLVLVLSPAAADTPRKLTWDDLVPAMPQLKDPFTELTGEQKLDLATIFAIREEAEAGRISKVGNQYETMVEMTNDLRKQGLDMDALLARFTKLRAEAQKRNSAVVDTLEGQTIRMPGYLLPLEFSGTAVKEFLLVPYVGACIHVPPPPPNQIVHVRLGEAFAPKDLFTPVMVTGRMSIKRSKTRLSYVDGESDVSFSYALKGIEVERYEEKLLEK